MDQHHQIDTVLCYCHHGHTLVLTSGGTNWLCDSCEITGSASAARYQCKMPSTACDYDICVACAEAPRCPKAHPLRARVGSITCDRCSRATASSFGCAVCNFDLCIDCYASAQPRPPHNDPSAPLSPAHQLFCSIADIPKRPFNVDVAALIIGFAAPSIKEAHTFAFVCKVWRAALFGADSIWQRFWSKRFVSPPMARVARTVTYARFRDAAFAERTLVPRASTRNNEPIELTPIENCEFAFSCPIYEEALRLLPEVSADTGNLIHFCDVCQKKVFTVTSQQELDARTSEGHCIAFHKPSAPPTDSLSPPKTDALSLVHNNVRVLVVAGAQNRASALRQFRQLLIAVGSPAWFPEGWDRARDNRMGHIVMSHPSIRVEVELLILPRFTDAAQALSDVNDALKVLRAMYLNEPYQMWALSGGADIATISYIAENASNHGIATREMLAAEVSIAVKLRSLVRELMQPQRVLRGMPRPRRTN